MGGLQFSAAGFGDGYGFSRPPRSIVQKPLRRAEEADDVFSHALFSETRLAPTFSAADIGEARVNGDIGITDEIEPGWKLEIEGAGPVTLDQIKALPESELESTQFRSH